MSMNAGKQSSNSSSRPLTPQEMQGYYDQALSNISQYVPGGNSYQAPTQKTLTGGDYKALEAAYAAPVQRQQDLALKETDQSLADRGIWSSLNAERAATGVREAYAPQFAAAGGQAIQAKAQEQAQGNQMALVNAAAKDAAAWRPADYYGQLWGTGKANLSSGKSSGWNGGFTFQ